jgi:hypothetical protein
MGKDIRIKPSSSIITFSGSSPDLVGSIELDNLGRLNISASDVLLGAGTNEVYIGDGLSPASIVFDYDGTILAKSGSGATLTIGSEFSPLHLTASILSISASQININTITASAARIANAILTGSLSSSVSTITTLSSSQILVNTLKTTTVSASTVSVGTAGKYLLTGSNPLLGGSIELDAQGNMIFTAISGSVFLSKDATDIYIGDGESQTNIVFDYDGAIQGESGSDVLLTLGSAFTRLKITGSNIQLSNYTASSALIQGGQITASAISTSALKTPSITGLTGTLISPGLSSSVVTAVSGTYSYISASKAYINTDGGGLYFTGSNNVRNASITVDNLGNLVLNAVSGTILIGSGSNEIYVGDGSSSAYFIFDYSGGIKANAGTSLLIGSSSANFELTGSTISIQKGGGNVGIGTNSPAYTLEVSGTLRTVGSVIFSSTASIQGPATFSGSIRITGSTAAAPSTTAVLDLPANAYGASPDTILGDPNAWLGITVDGINYKLPLYS